MKISVLDTKQEGSSTCYLCRVELSQYLASLSDDFSDWEIQRGIVNNTYLDSMIDTVLENRHIPPLVLVTSEKISDQSNIQDFKILDGLQRTFRLKSIDGSFKLIKKEIDHLGEEIFHFSKFKLSKLFNENIEEYGADIKIIRKIISKFNTKTDFDNTYANIFKSTQWFEIWYNLTISEQIDKMLMLNAGHVAVSTHHQIELLFRNLLKEIKESQKEIEIILSKSITTTAYSKKRESGQFLFSHIVSSFISLTEGKATPTNSMLIKKVQDNKIEDNFKYDTVEKTCNFLVELDKNLKNEYGDIALRWLSREVVLNGIFSAIGEYKKTNNISYIEALSQAKLLLSDNARNLNIHKFDEEKSKKDISKINIGKHSRDAVFQATLDILKGNVTAIKWSKYLGGNNE